MSRDHARGRDRDNGNNSNKRAQVDARGIPVVQTTAPSPKNSANRYRPIKFDTNNGALNDEVRIFRASAAAAASVTAIGNDKHSLINVYDSSQSRRDNAIRLFYRGSLATAPTATSTSSTNSSSGGGDTNNNTTTKKRRKRSDSSDDRQRKRRSSGISTSNNTKNPVSTVPERTTLPSPAPSSSLTNNNNNNDGDSQKTLCSSQEELSKPLLNKDYDNERKTTGKTPFQSKEKVVHGTPELPDAYTPTLNDLMEREEGEINDSSMQNELMEKEEEKDEVASNKIGLYEKEEGEIFEDDEEDPVEKMISIENPLRPHADADEPTNIKEEQVNKTTVEENKEISNEILNEYEEKKHVNKEKKISDGKHQKWNKMEKMDQVNVKDAPSQQANTDHKQQKELSEAEKKRIEEEKALAEEKIKRVLEEKKRVENEKIKADIDELNSKVKNLSEYYTIIRKIGEGTFSTVYEAIDQRSHLYNNELWQQQLLAGYRVTNPNAMYKPSNRVALKRVYSTSSPARLASEVQILQELRGCACIAPLITAFRHQDEFFVVMPYIHSDDFKQIYRNMSIIEIKCYFRSLFTGLSHLHSHNYIHRDVKPNNFLYDRKSRSGVLIDFGLAERVSVPRPPQTISQEQKSPSVSSQSSLAPPTIRQTRQTSQTSSIQSRQTRQTRLTRQGQALPTSQQTQSCQNQQQQKLLPQPLSSQQQLSHTQTRQTPQTQQQPSQNQTVYTSNRTTVATPTTGTTGIPDTLINQNRDNVVRKLPGYIKYDTRRSIYANRAGTKGFRAPEILFRERYQTGAIDVWSVGVILLSVITGRYPFFLAGDDADAIIELAGVFGIDKINNLANMKKLNMVTNLPLPTRTPTLEMLCTLLNKDALKSWGEHNFKQSINLLESCLMIDSNERITAKEALDHPFLSLEEDVLMATNGEDPQMQLKKEE